MSQSYQILVLDDDRSLAGLIKTYLENTIQAKVELTHSIDQFWNAYESKAYNLILLDYRLPNITGIEVLGEIKKKEITTPVIMMTGEGSEQIAVQAIQSGAKDYLVKNNELINRLPDAIKKVVQMHELQQAFEGSIEQIKYQALLLSNIREAVVVWDIHGNITFWNLAAYKLFGYKPNERLGANANENYINQFIPPVILPKAEDTSGFEIQRRYIHPDGSTIWVSSRTTPLVDEKNPRRIIGYIDISHEITRLKNEEKALKESKHFIQRILDTTPFPIYIYNLKENRLTFINHASEKYLQFPPEELIHRGKEVLNQILHPRHIERESQHAEKFSKLADGQTLLQEYQIRDRDQQWRFLLSREAVFQRDLDGSPIQIIGVAEDITDRKQAERNLRHRAAIESLIASISTDLVNLEFEQIHTGLQRSLQAVGEFLMMDTGYVQILSDQSESVTTSFQWFRSEELRQSLSNSPSAVIAFPEVISRLRAARSVQVSTEEKSEPDLERFTEFLGQSEIKFTSIIPMQYNGKLIGFVGFDSIQTSRKWDEQDQQMLQTVADIFVNTLIQLWSEERLRKSEALYRAIVDDHQTELISRFKPDTTLTFVNDAYCRFFNKGKHDLLGKSFLSLMQGQDRQQMLQDLFELTNEHPVRITETKFVLQDQTTHWIEWSDRAIFSANDELIEFQSVGRDITQRKALEERIESARAQLAQNTRLASLGELASGVAHLISNPLTTVIAEAQLLKQSIKPHDPMYESVSAIEKAGWRTQQVVDELLHFSQPTSDQNDWININENIEKALMLVKGNLSSSNISLSVVYGNDLPSVHGNARQLQDLWVNLLLLARNASADGKPHQIQISTTHSDNGNLVIEIADDGAKIPDEQMDNLFEPVLLPPGIGRGTGLELSICREIVRQHNGTIKAESSYAGTVFKIEFSGEMISHGKS